MLYEVITRQLGDGFPLDEFVPGRRDAEGLEDLFGQPFPLADGKRHWGGPGIRNLQ